MKKFTLLLFALLMVSFSALAQIKMIVHLNDAESIEVYASSVDSITFTNFPVEPDDETPDDSDKPGDSEVEDSEEDEITLPVVEAPGEGYTTIVLYIPESSCEGAMPYILGELPNGAWKNIDDLLMEFIGDNWWKVTVDALTEVNATNFKFRMDDGSEGWSMEPKGSYELLKGSDQYLEIKPDELNNLRAIADCDNKVLYVKSGKWSATPCKDPAIETEVSEPTGYENGYGYVDLGLPSGTKWATMNVGADSPEEYGYYFAWGETEPKDYYNWDSYKWMTEGMSSWRGVNKYTIEDWQTDAVWYNEYGEFIGDGKTTLDLEDDAANANWGADWRMPTKEDQDELRNNCAWVWSSLNGVKGYKVIGPNENSFFLPAAGDRYDSDLGGAGSDGYYWSSSLDTYYSDLACRLYFSSDLVDWDSGYRDYGRSVRAVLRE